MLFVLSSIMFRSYANEREFALLLKQLCQFYNHVDVTWVQHIWTKYYTSKVPHASAEPGSFWWKDLFRLNILFRGIASCTIGNGTAVTFWEDL
jgi:hypothetical protein